MKILLIGKIGQLGSALLEDATNQHHEVIAPIRQECNILNHHKFEQYIKEYKPDMVINTAAFNDTVYSETYPDKGLLYNFAIVGNMAKILKKYNTWFVTFSTDYVFNGTKHSPYTEFDLPHPIQEYGLSKLLGEYSSLLYNNTIIIRTCGLYGTYTSTTRKGNFVDNRIEDSKHNTTLETGNDQTVSPTYASDLSKATLQLITHKQAESGIYHLVNEGYCTWYEFTKEIYKIMNINTTLIPVNREGKTENMKRPLFSALENTKAKRLGIVLPHWKDALRRYLELKYGDK